MSLVAFTAVNEGGRVAVEWETASELDNLGFHVYRSGAAEGPYQLLTARPLPGLGSSPVGASYRYVDESVVSGRTYYYQLEDIETSGATERHGPVTVDVSAGEPTETPPAGEGETGTRIAYGAPEENGLRVVERTPRSVLLELRTSGFFAEPLEDGSVRLRVPGFEEGEGLPSRRTWVDVAEGKDVVLTRAWVEDERAFSSLRPGATSSELVATADGSVRLRRKERGRLEEATTLAELLDVAIQKDQKESARGAVAVSLARGRAHDGCPLVRSLVFRGASRQTRSRARRMGAVSRLTTDEAGLYAHPLPSRSRPRWARLSRHGEDVPFHVEAHTLFFVGEGGGAVYELEEGVQGTAMTVTEPARTGGMTDALWHTERREESHLYQGGLVERDDPWLWDALFAPVKRGYAFEAKGLWDAPGSSAIGHLRVWLQGTSDLETDEDHHVRVSLNGVFVSEALWDGKRAVELGGGLLAGTLREGENVLEVENVGDTEALYSLVMLDAFEVDYRRLEGHHGGQTHGTWHEPGTVEASWVVDTSEAAPRWVSGLTLEAGHRYLVATEAYAPEVSRVDRSRLLTKRSADWILIGPETFSTRPRPWSRTGAARGSKHKPSRSKRSTKPSVGRRNRRPSASSFATRMKSGASRPTVTSCFWATAPTIPKITCKPGIRTTYLPTSCGPATCGRRPIRLTHPCTATTRCPTWRSVVYPRRASMTSVSWWRRFSPTRPAMPSRHRWSSSRTMPTTRAISKVTLWSSETVCWPAFRRRTFSCRVSASRPRGTSSRPRSMPVLRS